MKAVIVGGGVMGLATAWALVRRGARVTVLERGPLPNPPGSSVDRHRLIRYPYGAEHGYTAMIGPAFAAWARLWSDLGAVHYAETGTLAIDGPGAEWARHSAETMARLGVPFEELRGAELARRWPLFSGAGIAFALFQPQGGMLFAERIVAALAAWLRAKGADMRTQTRAAGIEPDRARVELEGGGRVEGDAVVVAAGPWANALVPGLAARMTPSRQAVLYLDVPDALARLWAASPMLLDIAADRGFYAVPPRAGTGLKIGDHMASLAGDPDAPRIAAPADTARILAACQDRFAEPARYVAAEGRICFYDVSEGERFIVEPWGKAAWILSGFSGHGFKFGALMGEAVAAALAGASSAAEISPWAAGKTVVLPPGLAGKAP